MTARKEDFGEIFNGHKNIIQIMAKILSEYLYISANIWNSESSVRILVQQFHIYL